jgi:acyl carrier protein
MLNEDVRRLVGRTLRIESRISALEADAPLLGAIPELDSIAVVQLLTALEEHFGIEIADDDIDASAFVSLQALSDFVQRKLEA